MPALSFSGTPSRGPFWKLVQAGEKTITTRKPRKNPIKEGDTLYLYWKQRIAANKKPIHKIGHATCTKTTTYRNLHSMLLSLGPQGVIDYLDREGFDGLGELITWWTGEERPSYGIMTGGLLLNEETIEAFRDGGQVQVIEFALNSQQLRTVSDPRPSRADESKKTKSETPVPASSGRGKGEKEK